MCPPAVRIHIQSLTQFPSVAGSIYNNRLGSELSRVPGLTPELVDGLKQSVTIIATLPDNIREPVREASIKALSSIFLIPLICSALGAICALYVSWFLISPQISSSSLTEPSGTTMLKNGQNFPRVPEAVLPSSDAT